MSTGTIEQRSLRTGWIVIVLLTSGVDPSLTATEPESQPSLQCTSDFQGGSGVVETIDQLRRVIRIAPTAHKGRGVVAWWYVKVSGVRPGEIVTIDVGGDYSGWGRPDHAAFSLDGCTWRQTAPGQRQGDRIAYRQQVDSPAAWFAWGAPLLPGDAQELVRRLSDKSSHARAFELCRSREGRSVPALRVEQPGKADAERFGVVVCARQHAWEAGSSWVCRGLMEWLLSEDPRALTLRTKATIVLVPIMDVDNCARGAGGKGELPHDHNRDWCDQPHWPAVAAAMELIKGLDGQGRFDLLLDLHNPGDRERQPFFYVPHHRVSTEQQKRNLERFLAAVRGEMNGPYQLADRQWSTAPGESPHWARHASTWTTQHTAPHVLAVALETPWNTPFGTIEAYRTVGRQMGLALERYLRVSPRTKETDRPNRASKGEKAE